MASSGVAVPRNVVSPGVWLASAALLPLQLLILRPVPLYLLALTAMLFRPPDLDFYGIDRIAFVLLISATALRVVVLRPPIVFSGTVTWPLLALFLMSLAGLLLSPYHAEEWSIFVAKWVVPFVLFHVAQLVFNDVRSLRRLETYLLIVLGYLVLTAIFSLLDIRSLIFPRYILDENIGIHFDRARGPFLQAVANGVAIVLLSFVALDSYRRGRLHGLLALGFVMAIPLAVLATKTRAVWLSFAAAVLVLCSSQRRVRRACIFLLAFATLVGGSLAFLGRPSVTDRLEERSPVEFRLLLYQTGWDMLREKPFFGWPAADIQPELQKRMDGTHPQNLAFHNNYLEVAVNQGLIGLTLYLWLFVDLFRLAQKRSDAGNSSCHFLDSSFRPLWPVLVAVYAINACFVVMNYQFVNAVLFTLAGILAAQNRTAGELEPC